MTGEVNEGVVGDTAKLMMHRLIARMLRRDPSLVERASIAHARQADQFAGWPFVREWEDLLALPTRELASKLTSRDREMVRLRNSSPFYLAEGVDFGDYAARIRLRRAARRVVKRGLVAGQLMHLGGLNGPEKVAPHYGGPAQGSENSRLRIQDRQCIRRRQSGHPGIDAQRPGDRKRVAEIDAFPKNAKLWEVTEAKQTQDGVKPVASEHIEGLFGPNTQFHQTHGFFVDGSTRRRPLPKGWLGRAIRVRTEVEGRIVTGIAPTRVDLVVSKIARLDPRDRMFVEAIHARRPLDLDLVDKRIGERR